MPLHPRSGLPQQCARGEQVAVSPYPICKPRQRLPQCLACRFPLDLERAMPGLTTKESHPQERTCLRVLSPTVGIHPGIAPAFKVARFLWRKRQMERLHAMAEPFEKGVGICLILETRHKVIGKPVQVRFSPAVPPHPALESDI